MPEGIQIPITSLDLTFPGFTSATRNAQAFQASMERSNYSMREATASARLFNEELGTHMSRHLSSIMASSALLGPALQMALPIAAAVGFFEILSKVAEKLRDMFEDTEGSKRFGERMKAATDSISKLNEQASKGMKEAADVGASAQQKWSMALEDATGKVSKQKRELEDLSNKVYHLREGIPITQGQGRYQDTAEDLFDVERKRLEAQAALNAAVAEQKKAQAELTAAQRSGMDEYKKKLDESLASAKKHREEWEKTTEAIVKTVDAMRLVHEGQYLQPFVDGHGPRPADYFSPGRTTTPPWGDQVSNFGVSAVEPDPAVGQKYLQNLQDQKGWFESTRTAAEIYATALEKLDALYANHSDETYLRALEQINKQFESTDENTIKAQKAAEEQTKEWKKFGDEVEKNIMNAGFMKESWHKALQTILEDLTMLTVKLYVLGPLMKSLGTSGGGAGGFLSSLIGGLFGGAAGGGGGGSNAGDIGFFASGGYVGPGKWGIAGENGPEPIFGGSTGMSVLSNGALGRGSVTYNIDARGADVSVERRVMAAIAISHKQAVNEAVATSQERSLRR